MRFGIIVALVALLVAPSANRAAVVVTDIEHLSDAGGVWRNSTTPPNWAIWAADGNDPNTNSPGPFLNDAGVRSAGPPQRDDPTGTFTLPTGSHTYLLYKNAYGNSDAGTNFSLKNGAMTGTLSIPGGGAYMTGTGLVPSNNSSITLGDTTVTVTAYGWYAATAFNKSFVGDEDKIGDIGGPDQIASVTFNVSTVPEPGSLAVLGIGAAGVLARSRRR